MTERPHHDPLVDVLGGNLPLEHDALRQSIWRQTTSVLRRRRLIRRAGVLCLLAGCYAAGLLTMSALKPAQQGVQVVVYHTVEREVPSVSPSPAPVESAVALEWRAFDSTERRAELYERAGDLYLAQLNDVASAARCYRQSLDATPTNELVVSPDDSWLLTSIKEARLKERNHAQNGG
jgi:hypothetical protein